MFRPFPGSSRVLSLFSPSSAPADAGSAQNCETVSIVAGTARAFDQNGCGVQVLTINSTAVDLEYVRQDDPALKQCTPSLTHPDFEDNPHLRGTRWADVRWLLE